MCQWWLLLPVTHHPASHQPHTFLISCIAEKNISNACERTQSSPDWSVILSFYSCPPPLRLQVEAWRVKPVQTPAASTRKTSAVLSGFRIKSITAIDCLMSPHRATLRPPPSLVKRRSHNIWSSGLNKVFWLLINIHGVWLQFLRKEEEWKQQSLQS